MHKHKWIEDLKHLNLILISVPLAVILASAFFPLRPVVQQALVGIIIVWFGVIGLTDFSWWR